MEDEQLFFGPSDAITSTTMSTPTPQQATHHPEMYAQNATSASYYEDGDIVEKEWHLVFIFMAFVAAYIGSYSAIRLLEHSLWRSDRERANASSKWL